MLYPRGVKRVEDVPWPLQEAINHGLSVLAWFENYVSSELPPENLWDDSDAVEEHFRRVRERKDAGMSTHSDDDEAPDELMGNDLSSVFKE